jgi:hypothetical protein
VDMGVGVALQLNLVRKLPGARRAEEGAVPKRKSGSGKWGGQQITVY